MSFFARIIDADALREIAPISLRTYATSQGWQRMEGYGEHSDVYVRKGVGDAILPRTAQLADYASVIASIIELFSQVEGRDQLQIYRDLVTANQDVVRVRAPSSDDDGSIRLETGVDLFTQARDLMLSAACSASEPRATYRAGRVREAAEYISRVRLGQTERGSFIVALLSPVPPALDERQQSSLWPDIHDEPYERRVTRQLVSGLSAAKDSVERVNSGDGFSVFENAVRSGVSANLCESAANLIEAGEGIEVSVTWARTRLAPEKRSLIGFAPSDADVLREAGRRFRDREPRTDERLIGYIVDLHRESDQLDGRVVVRTLIDGRQISVRAELQKADYDKAIQAHDKQRAISVLADMVRDGHRWRLKSARDLEVLEPEDDADVEVFA